MIKQDVDARDEPGHDEKESPMVYLIAYIAALVPFGVVDAIWLSLMGPALYKPTLGDILLPDLRVGPAIAFYLIFPIGLVVFAVLPGLKSGSVVTALALGMLFGALAYATYDLTNFATLRNWTLQITLLDIAYGAIASGLAAVASVLVLRALSYT